MEAVSLLSLGIIWRVAMCWWVWSLRVCVRACLRRPFRSEHEYQPPRKKKEQEYIHVDSRELFIVAMVFVVFVVAVVQGCKCSLWSVGSGGQKEPCPPSFAAHKALVSPRTIVIPRLFCLLFFCSARVCPLLLARSLCIVGCEDKRTAVKGNRGFKQQTMGTNVGAWELGWHGMARDCRRPLKR